VVNIINRACDISRETIKPESHAHQRLGIDSLDFLDIAFAMTRPSDQDALEQWTQEVNEGKATTDQYFVLQNLCTRIVSLLRKGRNTHVGMTRKPACTLSTSASSIASWNSTRRANHPSGGDRSTHPPFSRAISPATR